MLHQEALQMITQTTLKPVFHAALGYLKSDRELALVLDDRIEFALFLRAGQVCVEERQAKADVEFSFTPEALRQLHSHPGDQLFGFGIAICELIAAGQMKIRVRSSLLRILTGGYLQLIFAAGPEFLQYLSLHGLSQTSKIVDLIRSLKK